MPPITRLFIKTGLLYFVAACALLLVDSVLADGNLWLTPTWLHLFVVGWISHLIFGVAGWLFPKHSKATPRGNERLAYTGYFLLNLGLLTRTVFEGLGQNEWRPASLVGSALLQWVAGILLVAWIWPRVKGK
jgi:hypothetical protein